ncbi:MAG: cupin domain-containing protein [Thermomicrobiales bacterium]|nr:cupin domain-containing protein [Thermomicrobiales bacterium]
MTSAQSDQGLWVEIGDGEPVVPFPGVELWTINTETVMLAMVRLAPGAVVPSHAHENEQTGGVVSGVLTFTIGAETRDVSPGQGYLIPANVEHSAVGGPDGSVVIEVFAPPRNGYRTPASQ